MNRKKIQLDRGDTGQLGSREKAESLLKAALAKKAFDPVLLRLEELTSLTDYFLIVSAGSARQVKSVAEAVLEDGSKQSFVRFSTEGINQGNWALLDYGDVIVHIFQKPIREFYDLEGLWVEAPREVFSEDIAKEIEAIGKTDEGMDDEGSWD
jgi:ribosome-associated protein